MASCLNTGPVCILAKILGVRSKLATVSLRSGNRRIPAFPLPEVTQ